MISLEFQAIGFNKGMPICSGATKINKTPRASKRDISRQHEVGLGVIFNELCEKMTASNHTKK